MGNEIIRLETIRQADPERPASLLHPSAGLTVSLGRDRERSQIETFLDRPDAFRWMAIFGDGGVGKTRLALEAAIAAPYNFV